MYNFKTAAFRWLLSNNSLFVAFFFVFPGLHAQDIARQVIEVAFDSADPRAATVRHTLYFRTPFHAGDTLWFYDYLNAYASIRSDLAGAIADHYKLEFHFSSEKERGHTKPLPPDAYRTLRRRDFTAVIPASEGRVLQLRYRIRLPLAKFTGLGYEKGKIHLLEFFWQPVAVIDGRPLFYTNKNLDDRPQLAVPTEIRITPATLFPYWESNARVEIRGDTVRLTHPRTRIEIIGSVRPFERYAFENRTVVLEKGREDPTATVLALDEIFRYLDKEGFPAASKIFITRRDLRQNPVFGADMLPVLNPFPEGFGLRMNLLKQILYKSGKELLWDNRRDHSIVTGLWQYYIKKYVSVRYPQVRLTGNPVRFPVVRSYYFVQAPYTEKYKQMYLYMARMNRDQALRLPADSLTLFNRNVTAPYKAALGWEYFFERVGDGTAKALTAKWFHKARTRYAGTDDFTAMMRAFPEACFLCGDYYRTAKKTDFVLRRKGDALHIRNRSGFALPYTLERRYADGTADTLWQPPLRRDTLIPADAPSFSYATVNAANPLPEINEKDNLAPRTKKPVKIRFWQDLEDAHSLQLFLNPDVDYNYYDGVILGMSLNNKTFFDKKFAWEIIPEYGLKSGYFSGYVSFKYKKHFVRPFLHGFSVGGYYSTYQYAHGKPYRSYSIYTTLSHKNRREKFFRENDITLEWLSLHKEADTSGITASYRLLMLSETYERRGLLKNMKAKVTAEWHPRFFKIHGDFRFRRFIDKVRQFEWRMFAGWMPYNRTGTDYFSFALSRPVDYLFKYNYYGRSETSGIFYQQYVYAEGAFKIFFDDQYADRWMWTHNIYIGIWKRLNAFADFGWMKHSGRPVAFHYDAGLRYYLVPDYIEFYFPLYYDGRFVPFDKTYFSYIRIMFVFDLPGLAKMFTRSWY